MAKKEDSAPVPSTSNADLVQAFKEVVEASKGPVKKTVFTRKANTPWTPPPGVIRLKLKRKMYQHGLPMREKMLSNAEIAGLNKIRPGTYCDGLVTVWRRKDKGLNIDYKVKTQDQRLRLMTTYGVVSVTSLCDRLVAEAEAPKKSEFDVETHED